MNEQAPDYIVTVPGVTDRILEPSQGDGDIGAMMFTVNATFLFDDPEQGSGIVIRTIPWFAQSLGLPPMHMGLLMDDARSLHTALGHLIGVWDDQKEGQ